ncbi:MAG: adaptin protein [Halobaculum sp.]
MEKPVLCFDRDRTVDVSPPETGRAVPLAWVQYYAECTTHDVWATGNPRLCQEAGIPSPREARELLVDAGVEPVAPYDRMNTGRLDRLRLLEQLYDAVNERERRFVVVDDTDVTAFTASRPWTYYQPDEFVEAVADGQFTQPDSDAVAGEPYGDPARGDTYQSQLDRFERRLRE